MTQAKENFFYNLYKKLILDHPLISLIVVILLTVLAASQLPKFRLDASGESLVLENDKSLTYYRQVNEQYGSDDFLIITWQPEKGLMSDESIKGLQNLTEELKSVQTVSNINSILNVPLLKGMSLDDALDTEIPTLQNGDVKREKALQEFTTSPIYKNLLVGEDGNTSAVQINFERDEKYFELLNARDALRKERKQSGHLTEEKQQKLSRLEEEFDDYSKVVSERTSSIIEEVRTIMDDYRDIANMHLGGISMITNDMLTFIQHDITVFGIGIILFIMLALFLFFGKLRWVILPLFSCVVSVVMLAGLLSFLDWRITVISSNFPSILLIVILALNVHLAVYYRDYISANPDSDLNTRVSTTVKTMFWPCFYTALTTIVAFVSLLISGIRPVIDFGWIMTIGIVLGFVITFIIFPSFIQLLKKDTHSSGKSMTYKVTNWIYSFTVNFKSVIFISTIAIIAFSAYGITQLKVENRFIDYFKPSTEIYQGMTVIDQKLGGTTPLDIVIDKGEEESLVDDDEFADEFGDEFDSTIYDPGYWFTSSKLKQVENIHDYIDSLEVTGKVQSIATYAKVLKEMEGGTYPDEVTLSLVHQKSPEDVKSTLMTPYLSEDGDQVRINIRVEETNPNLKRAELIDNINNYIVNEVGIEQDRVHFTGMLVLYNNMLESLFDSQIMTIGAVYLAILLMFIILFRSFILAILATIPNALSAALVLGIMGWMGVPMDMMTITIAAIVIGIAVDNSIHYVHRFKSEFIKDNDYLATMKRCHGSIGKAIYYTGITVIVGFAILALSEFIPSIYFGLLTGLAMAVALFLNLTLLPLMLITVKPLKQEKS